MRRKKRLSSVVGADRPHSHRRTRGRDLFFCFSSRPSTATAAAAATSSSASSTAAAMRVPSSKSLLSPGHSRDPAAAPSLSSSLSRRLRNSGSTKGGQSPIFPAVVGGGRRKGVAFEAAEPSSPKVTCIGQVRVKSKKKKVAAAKGKASVMRSRSVRGSGREASFRRTEVGGARECLPSRNDRWVYQLPVSICEAVRAFGSEFNCFSPCGGRSMCSSSSAPSGEGREECGEKRSNSCGAVFARWLMAVPDDEEGKRREVVEDIRGSEIGMVVNEITKREDLEVETEESEDVVMVVEKGEEKEDQEPRVSICIPPKNALLLMRCRSDPVRMSALTRRFWESPAIQVRVEEGDAEEEERGRDENRDHYWESDEKLEREDRDEETAETEQHPSVEEGQASNRDVVLNAELMQASVGLEAKAKDEVQLSPQEQRQNEDLHLIRTEVKPKEAVEHVRGVEEELVRAAETEKTELEERTKAKESINGTPLENEEDRKREDNGRRSNSCSSAVDKEHRRSKRLSSRSNEGGRRRNSASRERGRRRHSFSTEKETRRSSFGSEKQVRRSSFSIEAMGRWSFSIEKYGLRLEKEENEENNIKKEDCSAELNEPKDNIEVESSHCTEEEDGWVINGRVEDGEGGHKQGEADVGEKRWEEGKSTELPDCLLLMMYEPKLSMEVSKETWVCSTDFLQWRLHHPNYRPPHLPKPAVFANSLIIATTNISDTADEVTKTESSEKNSIGDRSREYKDAIVPIKEILQPPPLPPRSPPTASDRERSLRANAGAVPNPAPPPVYGPFELTRCKSEPMRSSGRLTPDACFWKDRHRPIGAAGVGF